MKVLNQQLNIKSKSKTNENNNKSTTVFGFLRALIKGYINLVAKGLKTSSIDWSRKI